MNGISEYDDHADLTAVVGMACRLPGAQDVEEFWSNLVSGKDSVTRFAPQAIEGEPSATYIPAGGFVKDPEWFDAGYFGYSPREALMLDPEHRVFLECASEALETAGCDPHRHDGAVGVFAGAGDTSYAATLRAQRSTLPSVSDWEINLATGADFLTARVAYKLGLKGPAITVRAACATSLVAVHLAVQALLAGECNVALAGGATIRLPAEPGHYSEDGIVSPDGETRSFDARARGIVPAQGACAVALMRLPDALDGGYPVRAVIRGSAVNNDGADRVGFTAPGVDGQAAVIRAAQLVSGVSPDAIDYVEAHGSATRLGDPIEMKALTRAFRGGPPRRGHCGVGSVKSNIGHTDTAAGGAGLIKTVLALERESIPPSLHFDSPNPEIDFAASPFRVVTRLQPWPRGDRPRRAGVSSFGMGGTNAHVVLEQAPPRAESDPAGAWQLLILSTRSAAALDSAVARLAAHLRADRDVNLADVAWTLQVGRREHPVRAYAVVSGVDDALRVLAGPETHRLVREPGQRPADVRPRQAFRWDELAALGERWLTGAPVAWNDVHRRSRRVRVVLPTYPFERTRLVVEADPRSRPARRAAPVAGDTTQAVADLFAEMLGMDSVEHGTSFFDLGGDSLVAERLLIKLRRQYSVTVDLRAMVEDPTPTGLAALIEKSDGQVSQFPTPRSAWLVGPRPQPSRKADLFCFPHTAGAPGEFIRWGPYLPDVQVWGMQSPGRGARLQEPPITRMDAMVESVVDSVEFQGRYFLFGHSLGALVAFEVARAVRRRGGPAPACLLVSGCPSPADSDRFAGPPIRGLNDGQLLAEVESRWGGLPDSVRRDPDTLSDALALYRADLDVLASYQYREEEPLSSPIVTLGGSRDPVTAALGGWRLLTASAFELHTFPGEHFYFRDNPRGVTGLLSRVLAGGTA